MINKRSQTLERSTEDRERMTKLEVFVSKPWKTFLLRDPQLQEDDSKFLTFRKILCHE